jgi:thiol-disulfide isomerase/thioredoxin
MTRQLTAATHDAALLNGIAVLVFLSDGSAACQAFRPVLDEVSERRPGIPFYVVDPIAEATLARVHSVRALPAIIVYRDGLPIRRAAGHVTARDLDGLVAAVMSADMVAERIGLLQELFETQHILSPVIWDRSLAPARSRPPVAGRGDFQALVIRTDYSDERAWVDLTTALVAAYVGVPGEPPVFLVDDPAWAEATVEEVLGALGEDGIAVVFLADAVSMRADHHAVLAVTTMPEAEFLDGGDEATAVGFAREFRSIPGEAWEIHATLGEGSMDFAEFAAAAAADPEGVFRGF